MRLGLALAIPLALAAAACGSGSAPQASAQGGEGGAASSSGFAGHGGTGSAGGGAGGAPYGSFGTVLVISDATDSYVAADFYLGMGSADAGVPSGCVQATQGGCTLFGCTDVALAHAGALHEVNGGTITLSVGATMLTLAPNPKQGAGEYADHMGPLWTSAGADVVAVGTGAEVPAFALHTPSPSAITVTAPTFPEGSTAMTVPTGADFEIDWTGGAAGDYVEVDLAGPVTAASFVTVTCTSPAASGHAVVPKSLLAMIPKGGPGSLDINVNASAQESVEGWALTLTASSEGLAPGPAGMSQNFSIEFE